MGQASIGLTGGVRRPVALRLLSDDRLAQRAALGDRGAFAVIFERHHQGLYRYCRAILRHDEDARDALQTAFTRAMTALDGDQRAIAIKPWLYRIAHNEAISLLRRRRPHDSLDAGPEAVSASPSPHDQTIVSERMRTLLTDLEQLPERQRSALLLRELNALTYAEIGAAIEASEQAARQSVYEARVMLMEFQAGRDLPCADVRQLISKRDGRILRPRRVRAHLRSCTGCTSFQQAIDGRRSDLCVIAPPLPAAAAAALLSALLGGGGGSGWGGGLLAALGAGKGIAASAGSKGIAAATALSIAGGTIAVTENDVAPRNQRAPGAVRSPMIGAPSISHHRPARADPAAESVTGGSHAARTPSSTPIAPGTTTSWHGGQDTPRSRPSAPAAIPATDPPAESAPPTAVPPANDIARDSPGPSEPAKAPRIVVPDDGLAAGGVGSPGTGAHDQSAGNPGAGSSKPDSPATGPGANDKGKNVNRGATSAASASAGRSAALVRHVASGRGHAAAALAAGLGHDTGTADGQPAHGPITAPGAGGEAGAAAGPAQPFAVSPGVPARPRGKVPDNGQQHAS